MMSPALDLPMRDRTAAIPCGERRIWELPETAQPVFGLRPEGAVEFTFIPVDDHYIVSGGTFTQRLLLDAYLLLGVSPTAAPRSFTVQALEQAADPLLPVVPRTAAQEAISEIRNVSAMTYEEIAPLIGVSRRSVHAWLAGGPISARKERRLRALLDTIRDLDARNAEMTRRRLFDRVPGNVRPYDLLAEGRFAEAANLALGRRAAVAVPASPQAQDLAAQLDHHEGHTELPPERLDRRFSGRLRR